MTVHIDATATLFLALLCLLFGVHLKKRIKFLQDFCIPSPVVGGFLMSLLIWGLRSIGFVNIVLTTDIQTFLMVAFFTTIGITGSFQILRSGGKLLFIYIFICWFLVLFQSTFGFSLAYLLGVNPAIGVMAGGVSLTGGHGGAAAFGSMAESLGIESATIAGIAAATFGLIMGSLLGGPIARFLIKRYKVTIESEDYCVTEEDSRNNVMRNIESIDSHAFLKMVGVILGIMLVGEYVSDKFASFTGFSLPAYVGAMIIAIVFRNINDYTNWVKINESATGLISNVSLGLFLTMAMMSLKIWELQEVALPLFVILVLQIFMLVLFIVFFIFRILGKDYDAAVMCAGLMGHGLGATPNAMANMSSVTEYYRQVSTKAFMIVPISGAVLVDLVGVPYHTYLINLFAG